LVAKRLFEICCAPLAEAHVGGWILLPVQDSELACLRVLVATVLALTTVIFGAELFVERRIAVDSHIDPAAGLKKKKKATLSDAVAVLRSSPMIFALSLMVISYGVGHRLFEFAWKGQLRMLYPSAMAYQVACPPGLPSCAPVHLEPAWHQVRNCTAVLTRAQYAPQTAIALPAIS
jgi:hypothetical protein